MSNRNPLVPAAQSVSEPVAVERAQIERPERLEVGNSELVAHANRLELMRQALEAQPKVRIRTRDDEVVQLNGYGFHIQGKVWVEVPEQVAQVLEEAGRL